MLTQLNKNPLLMTNYIKYLLSSRFLNGNIIKEMNGVNYEFNFNMSSQFTKKMYFNIYESDLIDVMRENLSKGNVFLDIGANVGYISSIGAGFVGKTGQVHSFEPVPEYAYCLEKVNELNPGYTFFVNNCACGDKEGFSKIDVSASNMGWNTMVPNFMGKDDIKKSISIPVCRLDNYIYKNSLQKIAFIKIDTEGFELKVLKGLQNYFENTRVTHRPPIYCEVAPAAYPLLRLNLKSLSDYMNKYSYYAVDSRNTSKRVDVTKLKQTTNVLFLCK